MLGLPKMRVKQCLGACLMLILLVCSLFGWVLCLEDKDLIHGLVSGLGLDLPSSELDENLEEVLKVNCKQELINFKIFYENLGFDIPHPSTALTRQTFNARASTVNNVKTALTLLHPQVRDTLFTCLKDNYLIAPLSGEDVTPSHWYSKHVEFLFPKSYPEINARRNLAEASVPSPAPAPAPAPALAPSVESPVPTPANIVVDLPPISSPGNVKGTTNPEQDIASNDNSSSHKTVIVAVVVTAAVTFLVATILFLCCRKCFGGSRFEHKDDRPLLSLSMSDHSVSGSSPKPWPSENSFNEEKIMSQSYFNNASSKPTTVPVSSTLTWETFGTENAGPAKSSQNASSSVLKPPPGRTALPTAGLPPLRPPPGRASPLPPEPPASLRPSPGVVATPPPPPPKPPAAAPPSPPKPPVAPPPPPPLAKRPAPPPPPGKAGPPPPKSGLAPPRPPLVAVKAGSSSDDAESNAAKAKLKPFFWDKVMANPDHSMVWHQIKSGSFQFNEEMIESLFGYAAADKNDKKKETSHDQPQFIRIIDHKKAQNLCILLRALNVTTEEVRDALLEGHELPSELLETLIKMAPTPEEELKLRLFDGDISQLGPAERFLKVIVDIPYAFRRFEALLFMGTLQEEASMIKDAFVVLEAACKELRNSRLFLKLLEAVLKTGNRMNDGTFRGGAQAFKLDTLLKLADVKGTDGKTTLLHFVVQEIIRSEGVRAVRAARENKSTSSFKSDDLQIDDTTTDCEDHYRSLGLQVVSGLGDQLENVKKAACLDSNTLTGSIAKLGTALIKTKKNINNEMKDVDEDGFHQKLKAFLQHAEVEITGFLEEEKRIMDLVKRTVDYFHGNSGHEEGLRLFVIVRDFLIMLEKVCREVKARPSWPSRPPKKDPPSRQSSVETPKTPFSPDYRQRLFPAIAERRMDSSSSDDDD